MKKLLVIGMLLIGMIAISLAFLPTEQMDVKQITEVSLTELQEPIVCQANILSSIGDFFKDLDFSQILALLFAGGLMTIITAVRKASKEVKDVKDKFKLYWSDKKLTPEEKDDLIKELGEAILAVDSVWVILSGLFKKAKKKE